MKGFIKNVSIYGILPVLGKFSGFFLLPVYTRSFSAFDFGILELTITLINFLVFFCSLEFYTSIGRYFYEYNDVDKKRLVSSGLWLTLFCTILIVTLSYIFKDELLKEYLGNTSYNHLFLLGLVWLFFNAISTYLSVLPRYFKKPKTFVLINIIGLLVRISVTLWTILHLKLGIVGVLYGHISGSFVSLIMYGIASKHLLGFVIDKTMLRHIINYAIPLVPGLLIIGFWHPISKYLTANYFSTEEVGYLSFALRITAIMQMLNTAVKLAWQPMLFENINNSKFKGDIVKLSSKFAIFGLYFCVLLTLFSHELTFYLGTEEYMPAKLIIGLLALRSLIEIITKVRGFSPMIDNNTKLVSFASLLGVGLGVLGLIILENNFGLIGVGVVFLIPSTVKYIILVTYTSKKENLNYFSILEMVYLLILFAVILINIFDFDLIIRLLLSIMFIIPILFIMKGEIKKFFFRLINL